MVHAQFRVYRKPHERLILLHLAKQFKCDVKFNSGTMMATVSTNDKWDLKALSDRFKDVTSYATTKVALALGASTNAQYDASTIQREFLDGFTFVFTQNTITRHFTELNRQGILAATEYEYAAHTD